MRRLEEIAEARVEPLKQAKLRQLATLLREQVTDATVTLGAGQVIVEGKRLRRGWLDGGPLRFVGGIIR